LLDEHQNCWRNITIVGRTPGLLSEHHDWCHDEPHDCSTKFMVATPFAIVSTSVRGMNPQRQKFDWQQNQFWMKIQRFFYWSGCSNSRRMTKKT
jgi:hypothetical protein